MLSIDGSPKRVIMYDNNINNSFINIFNNIIMDSITSIDISNNKIFGPMNNTNINISSLKKIIIKNNSLTCLGMFRECYNNGNCLPCIDHCGNGLKTLSEQCDDWNNIDGDGCSSQCIIEDNCNCKENIEKLNSPFVNESPSICSCKKDDSKFIIISISVGIIAFIFLITLLYLLYMNKRMKKDHNRECKRIAKLDNNLYVIDERDLTEMEKKIGDGSFGEVKFASLRGTTIVAIKKVIKDSQRNSFIDEVRIMCKIPPHPNIVPFLGVCVTISNKYIYIVMQYCDEGTLKDFLSEYNITNEQQLSFCTEIAAGLDHIHHHEIVHNDLSSRNILLMSSKNGIICKLSDFGLSGKKQGKIIKGRTVECQAPELISGDIYPTKESDIWSLGIVFCEIMYKCSDVTQMYGASRGHHNIYELLENGIRPSIPEDAIYHPIVYKTMEKCLTFDPKIRIKIDDVIRFLTGNERELTTAVENNTPKKEKEMISVLIS